MCHVLFLLPLIALALFFFLSPGQAAFVSVPLLLIVFWLSSVNAEWYSPGARALLNQKKK